MELFTGILTGILTGAPLWIWPLLLLLILLGLHASRDREMSILPYSLMPLIALSNVPVLIVQPEAGMAFGAWGLAYICGAGLGFRIQARWIIARRGLRAEVAGEWLSLAVMMLLFWANFANGVTVAVAPDLVASSAYQILFPALLGLASGSFLGRPVRILLWPNAPVATGYGRKQMPQH
ncbi:hypothetical protein PH5382_01522 [Phaeobacter sp. CECT 5382]|uniref:hypothetical protein n=1 Tax=Phaeobacter sp. CECT 5382 TaxID=1712645 RepID=UPI0006DA0B1B|nr:hypothetical protein [Phaeobacter sp. CECT 5382]CUH87593.1 hypothetical protein PH5382_01522 [Phaeobacter sp. CECT 5382]